MLVTIKPRLKLVAGSLWTCFDAHTERKGNGPAQAYARWLNATQKAATRRARVLPASAKARTWEVRDGVLYAPGYPLDRPAATRRGAPKVRDISPAPAPAPRKPAPPATYSAAQVQQVGPSVTGRAEYRTPSSLRVNQARALADQPAMQTISSPTTGVRN